MPGKALVAALWIVLGFGLPDFAVPAWCSDTNASERSIGSPGDEATEEHPSGLPPLTLDEVLTRTLKDSPKLSVFSQEIRAREFEALQAGVRPNPELSVEVENVAGSGEFSGTDSAETTVRVSQVLELGDKRARRQEVGRLEQELSEREYEIARAEVLSEATDRFIEVLGAQERLSLAGEQVDLAGKVLQTVEERIGAGKTAALEKYRFQTLVAEARLRQDKARQQLAAARRSLATVWGSEEADFETVLGRLEQTSNVPDWSELVSGLDQGLEVALRKSAIRRADRTLALERANRIPDLTLSLGARNDQDTGDNAMVAEVSIPLPIFDRNRGGIGAARARLAKARDAERAAQLQLRAELAEVWRKLQSSQTEIAMLREEILPVSRQTFDAVAYGYQAGKFGFLEVLDAERTLFEAKSRYVDALTDHHRAASELDRLLGLEVRADEKLSAPAGSERGQL